MQGGVEEVRGVKWSKNLQEFVASAKGGPPLDGESCLIEEAVRPLVHPIHVTNYVGTVRVATMTIRQVQQFFSRDVFREDCIPLNANERSDFYKLLCKGIEWNATDTVALAANQPALELFLQCYHTFLRALARTHAGLAAEEYIRLGNMFLIVGKFPSARACAQCHLRLSPPSSHEEVPAKRIILLARQCEQLLQASVKRIEATSNTPPTVVARLVAELDHVRSIAPLSREALHVQTGILVASASYSVLIEKLSALPPPLLVDAHVCMALARAYDFTGFTVQAMDVLRKMVKQSPVVAKELQRLQNMVDKRKLATKMAEGGHFVQAIDALTLCLTLDVNHHQYNANVLYDRAGALLAAGKEKESIRDLEQCLELNRSHALAPARLRAAQVQAETSRMHNQIYKEQRAHDKHVKKSSLPSVFFKMGSCPNLAPRDQVKAMHDRAKGTDERTTFHQIPPKFDVPDVAPLVDLYTILGVHATATGDEIRKAYHRLALQLHPDKCQDADAADQFKGIAMAYSILSDATSRAQFDTVYNSSLYST